MAGLVVQQAAAQALDSGFQMSKLFAAAVELIATTPPRCWS